MPSDTDNIVDVKKKAGSHWLVSRKGRGEGAGVAGFTEVVVLH